MSITYTFQRYVPTKWYHVYSIKIFSSLLNHQHCIINIIILYGGGCQSEDAFQMSLCFKMFIISSEIIETSGKKSKAVFQVAYTSISSPQCTTLTVWCANLDMLLSLTVHQHFVLPGIDNVQLFSFLLLFSR